MNNDSILLKRRGIMVSLEYLAFEVTRLCNEWCKMCMRGDAEDVNMTEDIVNHVLLDNYIQDIETIMFTGGEPTLNEKIVCYIIELIMKHKIPVRRLSMVTNAKKYPKDILEAFSDYQRYCQFNDLKCNITINFSQDVFHENYPEIIKEYQSKYPQFQYEFKGLDFIWKTGRAEYGDKFQYEILPMYVEIVMGYIWVMNTLYVTAKGNYETLGDGMYKDMDLLHMGSVFDKNLLDLIDRHGLIKNGTKEELKKLIYIARNGY